MKIGELDDKRGMEPEGKPTYVIPSYQIIVKKTTQHVWWSA